MKKLLCFCLLLGYTNLAMATNWIFLVETTSNNFYIDKDSIKVRKGFPRAWTKFIPFEKGKIVETMGLDEFSCSTMQYRNLSIIEYYQDDKNFIRNKVTEWRHIVPDTPVEVEYHFLCDKRKK